MKKLLCCMLVLLLSVSLLTGCSTLQNTISDVISGSKEGKTAVTRGTWENDIYSNEYMGFSFSPPEGWEHSTDEQMADLFGLGSSALAADGTFDYDLEKDQNIYDMFCLEPSSGDSIAIMYEKLVVDVAMDEYIDIVKKQVAPTDPSDSIEFVDEGTVTIAGTEYSFFELEYSSSGTRQTYAIQAIDNHMAVILITDVNRDETSRETLLNYFKAVK